MRLPPLERGAWTAAAELLDLPDELTQLLARHDDLKAERDRLAADPPPQVRTAEEHMLAGDDDPAETARSERAAAETHEARRRAAASAARTSTRVVARWIGQHRDTLIVDVLRPALAQVLDDAATHAAKLDAYAPTFAETAILRDGTKPAIDAWRASRELEERFRLLVNCWVTSWRAATARGGPGFPAHLRPDAPGGLHAWTSPHTVHDVDVRDGRSRDVLAVAAWREPGGWRLAGGQEMLDLDRRLTTYHPHIAGERRPRRVLLPHLDEDGTPILRSARRAAARAGGRMIAG